MVKAILRNLISNAIKYTENGEISVTASEINDKCKIVINDTGVGFNSEELKKKFEYFDGL